MMKKDGKEIYTFTGLINRMDACRNREYKFSEKDIPDEVEFRERTYKLSDDKKFYYDLRTGVTLSEVVGETYGTDMFKFLTEHEFIVTPKEKIFLTSEEREFLRMCNIIMHNGVGIDTVEKWDGNAEFMRLYFKKAESYEFVQIGTNFFKGLEPGRRYTLKELNIYE